MKYSSQNTQRTTAKDQDSRELEEKFITELSLMGSVCDEDPSSLPVINSSETRRDRRSILSILEMLCSNIKSDNLVIYFLIFVAGMERKEDITNIIRSHTDNFTLYSKTITEDEDPFEMISNDLSIVDKAFKHGLDIKSLVLIKYILESADKNYINATINDNQILRLIQDLEHDESKAILKYI